MPIRHLLLIIGAIIVLSGGAATGAVSLPSSPAGFDSPLAAPTGPTATPSYERSNAAVRTPATAANQPARIAPLSKAQRSASLAALAQLKTAPEASMAGYERDLFSHWLDPDGNGCDAREDALKASGVKVTVGERCKVLSGSWYDPYSGLSYTNPRQLDTDHIVPLAAAWRAGANRWTEEKRDRFANDQMNLLPVYLSLNRQKGDKGPEAWHPPLKSFHGRYAALWIASKSSYGLSVNKAERSKLTTMLAPAR